jgi:WD40 repeat protein
LRKFGDNRTIRKGKKAPSTVSEYHAGKSINSAFFSPSGTHLLLTTMADKLELFTDAQLGSGKLTPTKRINHNNKTGRWLTTFMAKWHDSLDTFVVGSMQQPRSIEVFDSNGNVERLLRGEGLTAVASRCCFHPTSERLIVVGGNSSGRVSVSI